VDLLQQAEQTLQQKAKRIEVVRKPSVFENDATLKKFLYSKCKLKFGPHGKTRDGMSEAWFDGREGSACMRRMKYLTEPLPKGKWGVLILEPRGAGKSTGAVCASVGGIADDPTETHIYAAQSIAMSSRRVRRVERIIKSAYPNLYNKDDWSHEQFTVAGADPLSEDPTMMAAAPDADFEGAHSRKYWFDDLVSDRTNSTSQKRRKQITFFEQLQKQFVGPTTVRAIGTRHRHHNLYEEIIDYYADEFVIFIMGCYDEATGENFYPWMSDEFLAEKEKHDKPGFQLSFMNKKVRVDEVVFEPHMFHYGEPPTIPNDKLPGGLQLHPRLNVFLLTDFGQSSRMRKGNSETALVVLAKDYDNIRYILDIDIGSYETDVAQIRFLDMYQKWMPHGLLYGTIEDRGIGRSLFVTLPQLAKASKEYNFTPALTMLARSSDESKAARVAMMYAPFSRGEFAWSKHFLNPEMFRIDAKGFPRGVAADRLRDYSEGGDSLKDFPDALADEGHISTRGPICPAPRIPKTKHAPLTDRQWSEQRALGKLPKIIVI